MNIESAATLKRIATLICSMAVIVCMGYAIGGAGGYLTGKGRPLVILLGLAGAAFFTCVSLGIWRSYLKDIAILNGRDREDE
ncbi:MAG: hypothetical protein LBK91_05595 [Synergistaceae bacterium]|jgi:hypothetical protein|nr:hypothetical protein [Synergistaceae bacterium]